MRTQAPFPGFSAEYLTRKPPAIALQSCATAKSSWRPVMATQAQPEKRSMRRFTLELPISVKFLNDGKYELTGRTRDVSSRGVYMRLNSAIAVGSTIEFVMTL